MPAGRPTTWSKALEKKAWEYADGKWQEAGHVFPSVVGLCSYIDRPRRSIYDWARHEDKQFSHILDKINQEQEIVAWNRGMVGDYNANLVKLLLGKHGYHDKQDQTLAGPDGGAVKTDNKYTIEFVNADDNPLINASSKDK